MVRFGPLANEIWPACPAGNRDENWQSQAGAKRDARHPRRLHDWRTRAPVARVRRCPDDARQKNATTGAPIFRRSMNEFATRAPALPPNRTSDVTAALPPGAVGLFLLACS